MADLHPEILETPPVPQEQLEDVLSPFEVEEASEVLESSKEHFLEEVPVERAVAPVIERAPARVSAPVVVAAPKDELLLRIEKILEEDLGDLYTKLPPTAQPLFKQKGEEASLEIAGMVKSLSLKVKRALELVRKWLLTIPGVNKFFLEQQAKIKIDKIQELINARKEELSHRP